MPTGSSPTTLVAAWRSKVPVKIASCSKNALLVRAEQVVAPVDGGPQRLLALGGAASAAGQDVEALVEPFDDLRGRQGPGAGRGELDGQRDAVDLGAQLVDGVAGEVDRASPEGRRPLQEEHAGVRARGVERLDQVDVLAGKVERLTAGGQHGHAGAAIEQAVGQLGRGIEDVLAVVEHDERGPVVERLDELIGRGATGIGWDQAGPADGGGDVLAVVERGQIGEVGATRAARPLPSGDLDGQARLAGARPVR